MKEQYLIESFEPICLTLSDIGPFREGPTSFEFVDEAGQPANMFLMMSKNGMGKTTILEMMVCLFKLLDTHESPKYFGRAELDEGKGAAQLDLLVEVRENDGRRKVILSILAGTEPLGLQPVESDTLGRFDADAWYYFGYKKPLFGNPEYFASPGEFVSRFRGALLFARQMPKRKLEEDSISFPSIIYFSAYRNIVEPRSEPKKIEQHENWGYRLVKEYGMDGAGDWADSLENLMVWLFWLDPQLYENARTIINERVFQRTGKILGQVQKQPPRPLVVPLEGGEPHPLYCLSSGEKSLFQLVCRIITDMTRQTIVLVDELDVHLHPRWRKRILNIFRDMAQRFPGFTLIAATHSTEILKSFAVDNPEDGLRKGAFILKRELE
jgi:hypothetical protein